MENTTLPDGPFTRAALKELGVSDPELYELIAVGVVRRIVTGAYVSVDVEDSVAVRAAGVAKVLPEHHVAIDRTAALLLEVDTLVYAEHDLEVPLETCALRGHTRSRRDGVDGHVRDLIDEDLTAIHGVRITTPLRTAMDLGCNLRRREAFAAMCALTRLYGLTRRQMLEKLHRFKGRRGVVQLRGLIGLVDGRIESSREAWTLLAIHDAELPLPEPQVWIEVDGVPTYRLDLAYRHARVCVEYDGYEDHDRRPEQREHDRRRRQWLRDNGWTIIVVRRGDFTGGNELRWLAQLREALTPGYTNRRW